MNKMDVLSLISYMLTSAQSLLNEPKSYGPLRLVDATIRMVKIMKRNGLKDTIEIDDITSKLDAIRYYSIDEDGKLISILDEVINDLVDLMY